MEIGPTVLTLGPRGLRAGETVLLAVRPEAIRLGDASETLEGENLCYGEITAGSFMGSRVRYWVDSGGTEWVVDVHLAAPSKLLTGQVTLQIPKERIHALEHRGAQAPYAGGETGV